MNGAARPSRRGAAALALAAAAAAAGSGCGRSQAQEKAVADVAPAVAFTEREVRILRSHAPLPAPPADPTNPVADDPAAARLGQALYFFDARLSADGSVSCSTCHDPDLGFTDGKSLAEGLGPVPRHTMALWNNAHNRWFFWDGRADTLWAQALGPIENANEHGASRTRCAQLVHDDDALRLAYESVFGPLPALDDTRRLPADARPVPDDPGHLHAVAWASMREADREAVNVVFSNLGKAIAAYVRRLRSADAPFDEFVAGLVEHDPRKRAALSPAAQRGLKLFLGRAGCRTCHLGPNFTDGEFHNTGVPPLAGGRPRDAGRYDGVPRAKADPFNATGPYSAARDGAEAEKVRSLIRSSETWGQFKTPSLRHVARTAPYMHQGQIATLEDVLRYYSTLEGAVLPSHHQEQLLKPLNLTEGEIDDLVAFLESLTGAAPDPALLAAPGTVTIR